MRMWQNLRLRAVLIAGVSLAVVAAIGIGAANASVGSGSSRWVTGTAATGDVTQTYLTTGTISRQNTAVASFTANGTVTKVLVSVGDTVHAGQALAAVDSRTLTLAVLEAETSVARAELSLYNAQHPASANSATSAKSSKTTNSSLVTVSLDLTALNAAVKRMSDATTAEASSCDPIMAWATAETSGTTTPADGGATTAATPEPVTPASASDTPTTDQVKACATARAELGAANTNLTTLMAAINTSAGSSAGGGSSATKKTTTSKAAIASARATLLQAQQNLASAQSDLDAAELTAPISGTVGAVSLSKGASASSGSITIVGKGEAQVSVELPLKTRSAVTVGTSATVTPAGSLTSLSATITAINALETSGTSGATPTYTTTISVDDPDGLLASGAKATVSIPVVARTGVVTVPVSALTPTGTGTGTVLVLAARASTPTLTQVKTGAIGGGRAEITEGLTAGQVVVLADSTAATPANASRSRTTTKTSSGSSTSSSGSGSSSSAAPAPQPTASASR